MTREEAITYLKVIWNRYKAEYEIERETLDAYHIAIEALTEPINCVKCKHYYETEDDTDVHGHCRMDTAHTNPISKAVQGCDINKGAWLIPIISLVALAVAVVGLLAEIHFLFL